TRREKEQKVNSLSTGKEKKAPFFSGAKGEQTTQGKDSKPHPAQKAFFEESGTSPVKGEGSKMAPHKKNGKKDAPPQMGALPPEKERIEARIPKQKAEKEEERSEKAPMARYLSREEEKAPRQPPSKSFSPSEKKEFSFTKEESAVPHRPRPWETREN